VTYRHNWGEERAFYRDAGGELVSVPASWTDLSPDPFEALSAGRAAFRVPDLLELVRLIRALQEGAGQ